MFHLNVQKVGYFVNDQESCRKFFFFFPGSSFYQNSYKYYPDPYKNVLITSPKTTTVKIM